MPRNTITRWLITLLIAATPATFLFAQANITGQIEGNVLDGQGRGLPGVTLTLEGPAIFGPRQMVTNHEGHFRFVALPVGRYMLEAELVGYQTFVTTDIVLNAGENRNFLMTLFEGLIERVTVVAEQNLVDTQSTQTREVLDSDYVNSLPLSSRRFQEIFSLFPGVTSHTGRSEAQFHLHGGTTYQIGYRVDGATINSVSSGRFGANINQNAIERFEVISGGIPAEYGEQSAGILNVITRSGTNDWQFFYSGLLRNGSFGSTQGEIDDLENALGGARTFNNPIRQKQQWHEFNVSGPIIKDKLWLFAAGQYWQEDLGGLVATEAPADVDNFTEGDRYNFQIKLNWQINPNNEMVFNIFTDPAEFKNIELLPTVTPEANRNQKQGGYLFQVRDTHIFSSDTFLETQYFLHHSYLAQRPANPEAGIFIQNIYTTGLFTGAFYSDLDNSYDRQRLSASLTHIEGNHTIKAGFDYSFIDYRANNRKADWVFDVSSGSPAFVINDFGEEDKIERDESEVAAFIQDRISLFDDRLSVDVGLRFQQQSIVDGSSVAPRLGVSYDPLGDGRTRVFANYGHFYDSVFFSIIDRFDNNDGITTFYSYAADCSGLCIPLSTQSYDIPDDLEQSKKEQWQLGFERELPGGFRVGITHTRWDTDNDLLSTFNASTGENLLISSGRADYRGTELTIRKPVGRRMELFGSWTHSRTRSQVNSAEELSFLRQDDPLANAFTRAAHDRPDVVNLSARFKLPGSFDLTAIYRYQDGRLISPLVAFDVIDSAEGKNSFRLAPYRTLDLLVARSFNYGGADLKLLLQVFNVTNEFNVIGVGSHTNLAPDNINFLGTPQLVDIPRTIQAGIEIRF
ncbi:MAG: TonB-dependent receptor [Acidobacteriota bacterium]